MHLRLSFAVLCALLACSSHLLDAQAEYKNRTSTNFGLRRPHRPEELPSSRSRYSFASKVNTRDNDPRLEQCGEGQWRICGGWELNMDGSTEKYAATVPGTVLTTLCDNGVYPDPAFGLNNLHIPESLCRTDWWYSTTVCVGGDILEAKQVELLFNGINYKADVWFNGTLIGGIKGAFVRGRFDVSSLIRPENELKVHIYPPQNPGIPHEQSARTGRGPNGGILCLDGPTFISSEGWDWMPGVRDRNIGIWQDVLLITSGGVTIRNPQIVTDLPLPDTSYADITLETRLVSALDYDAEVELSLRLEDIRITKQVIVPAHGSIPVKMDVKEFPQLRLGNPKLWMPNGYGEPNLYNAELVCKANGVRSSFQNLSFGVREYSYELTADAPGREGVRLDFSPTDHRGDGPLFNNRLLRPVADGVVVPSVADGVDVATLGEIQDDGMAPFLVIKCNDVRIFCRGGNWGMDDILKRCSRERLEPYFLLHREAGFNMVRNWTGECAEEVFYQLCDEYGLMVWNDFWMSTEGYNLDPSDEVLFVVNATDVVRRFRNHPSIAIWCPRNEGYARKELENDLQALVAREDGTRFYSPNSRYCNLRPSGPWKFFPDLSEYYSSCARGFSTEIGSPSVPTAATISKFMAPEDRWPIGDVWCYHDMHPETGPYIDAVNRRFGESVSLEDFCRKAQYLNYDSYRAMFEAWNSRMWCNTSGVLLWMTHPAWPSMEWQCYSYDCETHASWYGCKKACEPLHVQMALDSKRIQVVNTSMNDCLGARVELLVADMSGRTLAKRTERIDKIPAGALVNLWVAELPLYDGVAIVRLSLLDDGVLLSVNDYLMNLSGADDFRGMESVAASEIVIKPGKTEILSSRERLLSFTISNRGKVPAIRIPLRLEEKVSGVQVLPAIFSDNYFNLLPGETRALTVRFDSSDEVVVNSVTV